jgi:hypothetical protein
MVLNADAPCVRLLEPDTDAPHVAWEGQHDSPFRVERRRLDAVGVRVPPAYESTWIAISQSAARKFAVTHGRRDNQWRAGH